MIFCISYFVFAACAPALAALRRGDRGTAGAAFLKLGAGGRALGMGEAYTLAANDASAVFWNPAALLQIPRRNDALLMHSNYLDTLRYDFAAFARRGERTAAGLAVQYFSPGPLDGMDASGAATGDFRPRDAAVTLALARRFEAASGRHVRLGAAVKAIDSKITARAQTAAADLGFIVPFGSADRFLAGAAVQNIGPGLKYRGETDPLPLRVKLGSAFRISESWLASAEGVFPRDDQAFAALGTEYGLLLRDWIAWGRLGFNTRAPADLGGWAGLSVGAGIEYRHLSLNYALVPFDDLGDAHYFSVGYGF